ncbi:MAG: hypothetical protein QXI84_06405 [Thermofilaceae archaeon]
MGIKIEFIIITLFIVLIFITYSLLASYLKYVIVLAALFGILVATYDFTSAKTGYINLGYTFVFGIAGYSATLLSNHVYTAFLLSALGGVLGGIVMWLLSLKLKGPYFAVATMVLPLLLIYLARSAYSIFKGDDGISLWSYTQVISDNVVFTAIIISVVLLLLLNYSRIGRLADAIAMDEMLIPFYGININLVKLIINLISCAVAGVISFLYVAKQGIMSTAVIEPIPYIIYMLLATGIRPGSTSISFTIGFLLYLFDIYLSSTLPQAKLFVIGTLLVISYFLLWRRYANR